MLEHLLTLCSLLPFYLLVAFPTGQLVASRRGVDLAAAGSGNVGATNAARVLGKNAGLVVLAGDIAKGAAGVALAGAISSPGWYPALAAVAVTAGHCFSLPGRLRGGKGVATGLGASLVLTPLPALLAAASFAGVFGIFRITSLASVSAALLLPLYGLVLNEGDPAVTGLALMTALILFRHRANLARLAEGREEKFSPAGKAAGAKRPDTNTSRR